jgi:hypothetical protein
MTRQPPRGGGSEDRTKAVAAGGRGTRHAQSWIAENIFGSKAPARVMCVCQREDQTVTRCD